MDIAHRLGFAPPRAAVVLVANVSLLAAAPPLKRFGRNWSSAGIGWPWWTAPTTQFGEDFLDSLLEGGKLLWDAHGGDLDFLREARLEFRIDVGGDMQCHECDHDAVGACRSCGRAYCGGHGADLCQSCAVAIVAGPPGGRATPRRVFLQCENRPRMPTIYLDDDPGPPSCHICDALARQVCEHCHKLYCHEHAGHGGWCQECARSARTALYLALGVFGSIGAVLLGMFLLEHFRP